MCGIIGYTGDREAADVVMNGLENLEYRGYDSAGMVVINDGHYTVQKAVGEVHELADSVEAHKPAGNSGIGHTRWATHGGVTEDNAHPHTCDTGRIVIVHNGIIENYEELRAELQEQGHTFSSDTDSEVIAHFLGEQVENGATLQDAVEAFADRADGAYAFVAVDEETEKIVGFRHGSPLTVGVNGDEYFIASDVHAFGDYTKDAIFLKDDEYVVVSGKEPVFYSTGQGRHDREPQTVDDEAVDGGLQGYEHHMLKEIHEQPAALHRLEESLQDAQAAEVQRFVELLKEKDKVLFTAAGTSYHASLLGVFYLQKAGIEAQTLIASEFQNYERVDEDTLLVAVSQSGETRDTLDAIEYSKERGATVASIVNMPHSAIQRESEVSLAVQAGREVAVAATKTFSNTVLALLHLAIQAGYDGSVQDVSQDMQTVIDENEERIADLAADLADEEDMYVIGRGATYPVSREIALKLKEVPYVHAEGMMGGELKHGTLALIEDGTPVFALVPGKDDDIVSNMHEIEARGGNVIEIGPYHGDFTVPNGADRFPLFATSIGFLLSYYLGKERGCPIDKPRNLAKTVTVR